MKAGLSTGMIQRGQTGGAQCVFALLRAAGFANAHRFDWHRNAAETLGVYERAIRVYQ